MPHNRLPDKLDSNARVEVRVNGVVVGTRRIIDLIGAVSGTDDGTNDKVTIHLTTGGGTATSYLIYEGTRLTNDPSTLPGNDEIIFQVGGLAHAAAFVQMLDNGSTQSFVVIDTAERNTDEQVNIYSGGDINLNPIRDVNITPGRDLVLNAGRTITFNPMLDTLLADTGVVAGTYGTSVKIPRFTVDAKGRLSGVTELPVPTPSPDHLVHAIFDHYANQGNGTTVETDLYTDTLAANLLANNGDKIEYRAGGTFVNSATATRELKLYFGGTAIFDTGALTISAAASWDLEALFIRVSSSVVRYTIKLNTEFAALSAYTAVGELTGLTLSNTQVVKITGQAAGVGAATNDIVAKVGSAMFWPAV